MSDIDIMRCDDCGELFGFLARGVCGDCLKARDEAFWKARDWFRDNRGASISAASAALGISMARISGWVREGRLKFAPNASADDADLAKIRADQHRASELRKAFAESAGTHTPSAPTAAPPTKPRTDHGGMYGRRNDA
jgi:hypothetical protein